MLTKEEMPACPVATTVALIGSKWKLLILRNLMARPWRFNELKKDLNNGKNLKTHGALFKIKPHLFNKKNHNNYKKKIFYAAHYRRDAAVGAGVPGAHETKGLTAEENVRRARGALPPPCASFFGAEEKACGPRCVFRLEPSFDTQKYTARR